MRATTKNLTKKSGVSIYQRGKKFRVVLGKKITGTEKIDRQLESEDEAVDYVKGWLHDRTDRAQAAKLLSDAQLEDAYQAIKLKKEASCTLTLVEVMRKYLETLPTSKPILIGELCDAYIADRDISKRAAAKHLKQLEYSFKPLRAYFSNKYVHEVTGLQIEDYLSEIHGGKSPKTYNTHLTNIAALWRFALRKKYITDNVTSDIAKRKIDTKEAHILLPSDMQGLLAYAQQHHPKVHAAMALQAFAGLRRAEACRLTWGDVRGDYVVVTAAVSKTNSRRTIPILPPLRAILDAYQGMHPDALVWSGKNSRMYGHYLAKCGVGAGVTLEHNCLRHSFCTYRLMDTQNENATALEAGHSVAMLNKHYKGLTAAPQEDAGTYWRLFVEENVTTIKAG